jgi:hypothetical protein
MQLSQNATRKKGAKLVAFRGPPPVGAKVECVRVCRFVTRMSTILPSQTSNRPRFVIPLFLKFTLYWLYFSAFSLIIALRECFCTGDVTGSEIPLRDNISRRRMRSSTWL